MSSVVELPNNLYKLITNPAYVSALLCSLLKRCTLLATASDRAYQLLAHGRWLSLGTPASSTTKTSRHDIAETLLKVWLSTINQIKSNHISDVSPCTVQLDTDTYYCCFFMCCTTRYWHIFLLFLHVLYN